MLDLISKEDKTVYVFSDSRTDVPETRNATVTFNDDVFTLCEFDGVSTPYSANDWDFLGQLGVKITELIVDHSA